MRPDLTIRFALLLLCANATCRAQQFEMIPPERLAELFPSTSTPHFFDADGDGDLDILTDSTILENVPAGRSLFEPIPLSLPAITGRYRDVAFGDLDGDGDTDIALLVQDPQAELRVFANDGSGVFTDVTAARVPAIPDAVRVALSDLDGDSDLDIVIGGGTFVFPVVLPGPDKVLINNGQGFFTDQSSRLPTLPLVTRDVDPVDVDMDGDVDLAISFVLEPAQLWINDGSGHFTEDAGALPNVDTNSVSTADIDGDGDVDLALTVIGPPHEFLLFNDGQGNFTDVTATHLPVLSFGFVATNLASQRLFDIDSDGDLDIFVRLSRPFLRRNMGSGFFAFPEDVEPASPAAFGDVDGDGDLDFLANPLNLGYGVFTNDGTGAFEDRSPLIDTPLQNGFLGLHRSVSTYEASFAFAQALGLDGADGDLDGDFDVLDANASGFGGMTQQILDFRRNAGEGRMLGFWLHFTDFEPTTVNSQYGVLTRFGDVTGDGRPDLVTITTPRPVTPSANGSGFFQPRLFTPTVSDQPQDVTATHMPAGTLHAHELLLFDADGDVDLDLFVATGDPQLPTQARLFRNDGTGVFTDDPASIPSNTDDSIAAAFGDFDGDGDLDIVLGKEPPTPARWLRNDGSGSFTDAGALSFAADLLLAADFDEDGDSDLIASMGNEVRKLFVNDGSGSFTEAPNFSLPANRGIGIGDVDGDLDVDIAVVSELGPGFGCDVISNLERHARQLDLARAGQLLGVRFDARPDPVVSSATVVFPILGLEPARLATPFGDLGFSLSSFVALPPLQFAPHAAPSLELNLPIPVGTHDLEFVIQGLLVDLPSLRLGVSNAMTTRVIGR